MRPKLLEDCYIQILQAKQEHTEGSAVHAVVLDKVLCQVREDLEIIIGNAIRYQQIMDLIEGPMLSPPSLSGNRGKEEIYQFEEWAANVKRLNCEMHPLHYIFMDPTTNTAREAWIVLLSLVKASSILPTKLDAKPKAKDTLAEAIAGQIRDAKDAGLLKGDESTPSMSFMQFRELIHQALLKPMTDDRPYGLADTIAKSVWPAAIAFGGLDFGSAVTGIIKSEPVMVGERGAEMIVPKDVFEKTIENAKKHGYGLSDGPQYSATGDIITKAVPRWTATQGADDAWKREQKPQHPLSRIAKVLGVVPDTIRYVHRMRDMNTGEWKPVLIKYLYSAQLVLYRQMDDLLLREGQRFEAHGANWQITNIIAPATATGRPTIGVKKVSDIYDASTDVMCRDESDFMHWLSTGEPRCWMGSPPPGDDFVPGAFWYDADGMVLNDDDIAVMLAKRGPYSATGEKKRGGHSDLHDRIQRLKDQGILDNNGDLSAAWLAGAFAKHKTYSLEGTTLHGLADALEESRARLVDYDFKREPNDLCTLQVKWRDKPDNRPGIGKAPTHQDADRDGEPTHEDIKRDAGFSATHFSYRPPQPEPQGPVKKG